MYVEVLLLGSGEGTTAVLPFVLEAVRHGNILVDFLKSSEVPRFTPTLFVEGFDGLFKLVVGAESHGASAVIRYNVLAATEGNVPAVEDIVLNSV